MKITNKIVLIAVAGMVTAVGCKEQKSEDKTVAVVNTTQMTQAKSNTETATPEMVPDSINSSFMVKYPTATKVNWKPYVPQEGDGLSTNDRYYYVSYNSNGADYTSLYDNRGLWVRTSTIITGPKELPDAVNKTVDLKFPGYTIEKIEKEEEDGIIQYELKLTKGEQTAKLKVLPNGEIAKQKLKD